MNFLSLDYFIMTARERSFTRAAERLYITQQTLSTHIAAIEKELGCQLFVRHIPLKLTYAGEVYLRYALDIQKKLHSMQQEMDDIAHNEKGKLRIGVGFTRGHAIMPDLISEYQKQYPFVQIQLIEGSNDIFQKKLFGGEIDLAIANFPENVSGMELRDFYREELVLLVSETLLEEIYGEKKEQILEETERNGNLSLLRECPFLLNSKNDIAGGIGRSYLAKAGFEPILKAESDSIETLLDLCLLGGGACFCPENLAEWNLTEAASSKLRRIRLGPEACYMIRFGYLKQAYQWSMMSNFMDLSIRRFA